jgi:hypothetical protein
MTIKLNYSIIKLIENNIGVPRNGRPLKQGEFGWTIVEKEGSYFALQVYAFLEVDGIKKEMFYSEKLKEYNGDILPMIDDIKNIKKRLEFVLLKDLKMETPVIMPAPTGLQPFNPYKIPD